MSENYQIPADAQSPSVSSPEPSEGTPPTEQKPGPTDGEAKLLREVMALKGKLKDRDAALARFDGIDPEELRAALDASQRREHEALAKAGKLDELREALSRDANKQIADLTASCDALRNQLDETVVSAAFANSAFLSGRTSLSVEKARQLYDSYVTNENGRVVVHDAPLGATSRLPFVGGDAEPLPFDRAMERLIELRGDTHVLRTPDAETGAARHPAAPSIGAGIDAIGAALKGGALARFSAAQKAGVVPTAGAQEQASPGQGIWRDQAAARIANGLGSLQKPGR